MKMRVILSSNKGKMQTFADIICQLQNCKSDKMPPAYPCENERLVIVGATVGKDVSSQVLSSCKELTKQRAQNVAFFIDGPEEGAKILKDAVRQAGSNVIEEVFYCKGGVPLKFIKGVSDEEKTAITTWIDSVLKAMK